MRLRSPFEGGGNETAWMVVAPDGVAGRRRLLPGPQPAGARPPTACGCAASIRRAVYRVTGWPDVDDPLVRANAGERGGDELMRVGLSLGAERHEAAQLGRLPGLAVRPRGGLDRADPVSWCVRHPFTDLMVHTGPIRTILDRRDGPHAARAATMPEVECMRLGDGP